MKFNMGCGGNQLDGYLNVDASPVCQPDQVYDLEQTPWPWEDNCAQEVRFNHSLEHMGADTGVFLAILKETYRIAAPDALIVINVPHPRHDHFMMDPTHVRAITADTMRMFDKTVNDLWRTRGEAATPLAYYIDVDFVIEEARLRLSPDYQADLKAGRITQADVELALKRHNNVANEIKMRLRARKTAAA